MSANLWNRPVILCVIALLALSGAFAGLILYLET